MKKLLVISLLLFSTGLTGQDKPLVVVELFTSEGCSSCPPADRLLSSIVDTPNPSVEILGLSFHIDYWDYIGWKDPYASNEYTTRQRAYARKFGLNTIYTPQMIVNGKHEFVGSSSRDWNNALSAENGSLATVDLQVSVLAQTKEEVTLSIKSNRVTNSIVNVALVEKNLSQDVKRGENRGRKLSHDNVVRSFEARSFDGKENRFTLQIPADIELKNASLIIYSQSSNTWKVNGGKQLPLAVSDL